MDGAVFFSFGAGWGGARVKIFGAGAGQGKGQNLRVFCGAGWGSPFFRGAGPRSEGRSSLVPTINCPDICIETLVQVPDCTSNVYSG